MTPESLRTLDCLLYFSVVVKLFQVIIVFVWWFFQFIVSVLLLNMRYYKQCCVSLMSEDTLFRKQMWRLLMKSMNFLMKSNLVLASDLDLDDSNQEQTFPTRYQYNFRYRLRQRLPDDTTFRFYTLEQVYTQWQTKRQYQIENEVEASSSRTWVNIEQNNDIGYTHNFYFHEISGPKHCSPPEPTPISYFFLFFKVNLLNTIIKETNQYAEKYILAIFFTSIFGRVKKLFYSILSNLSFYREMTPTAKFKQNYLKNIYWWIVLKFALFVQNTLVY